MTPAPDQPGNSATPASLPLRTERTLLRLAEPEDAAVLVAFHTRNFTHLAPSAPRRPEGFLTEAYWQQEIARNREDFAAGRSARLLLYLGENPQRIIGAVNLNNITRGAAQYADLGYALDAEMQGQGLMLEAVSAVIAFAFGPLNLHRIRACYLPTNERSGAVLRRLGFVVEGYARDYLLIDGRWQDQILTSLINPDWQPA
jgi:ribosomal-protein-alanine N-acetyltransferase